MIGNDVVDLHLAHRESNWQRPRFLQKLYTAEEQKLILNFHKPEFMVWMLWSMKESVYKATQREFRLSPKFNAVQFKCLELEFNNGTASAEVCFNLDRYETKSVFSTNYIHTYTANARFIELIKTSEIKSVLCQKIALEKGLKPEHLAIRKDRFGIPFCTYFGVPQKIDFSLSQHGTYSSFALS